MQVNFGLVLELMVLVLLATTVGYCFVLNKKLQGLRADEQMLRQTIRELCTSIDSAERAVEHMRKTAVEREATLKTMIESADASAAKLRDAQSDAHESLTLIQQQTNFSLEIVNRLKVMVPQAYAQPQPAMAVDIAPEHYIQPMPQEDTAVTQKRRPFSGLGVFGRGGA